MRHYVLNELKYLPGASRSFDRHLGSSFNVFTNLVTNNSIHSEALPSILHCELSENAELDFILHQTKKRGRCVQGCLFNHALTPLQVHKEDFINASREYPFTYNFTFPRPNGQSDASYDFQKLFFIFVCRN